MTKILQKAKILSFCYGISMNGYADNTVEKVLEEKNQQQELPSLELLLYLGEFQDKDGSLLEPEKFDNTLKLKETEQIKTDETIQNETNIPKVTKVKKDDGDE